MDIEIEQDEVRPASKKNDKGFTLIELLIVIVILGVLSTVVVISVGGITDQGKASACKSDYNAMATAVETFYAQEGAYPADQAALVSGGFLRNESANYDVGATGAVTAASTDCQTQYDPETPGWTAP